MSDKAAPARFYSDADRIDLAKTPAGTVPAMRAPASAVSPATPPPPVAGNAAVTHGATGVALSPTTGAP